MKLTLVRHTSLAIAPGVCYGQTDVDVAASFVQEASRTRKKLPDNIDAAFSSPLQRCVKLANALALDNITYDGRLKELHFGDWEMQAWDDMPRAYLDEWGQNYAHMSPPNGETFRELQLRGISFIEEMLTQYHGKHIVIVTHGGMVRALLAHVLSMELKGLFRFNVDYGSVTQLDFSNVIPKVNFVNH
ncbi:MAG: alpha-ribazole phosphatase [Methylophilaceae bacterium]|nr:alpha-ribazole phosphatase [Methylophilaceae bacterium]